MASKTAIGVLSGGLDSAISLYIAQKEGVTIPLALTFDYGQRAARKEIEHAKKIADYLDIRHQVIPLPWFSELINSSALTNASNSLPSPALGDLLDKNFTAYSARAVWVPNRNGIFLEIASGIAESMNANYVIVGFNAEEAETFPDNSIPFIDALNASLMYSTSNHVRVISPTASLIKKEIVRMGTLGEFPFHLLWSCYEAREKMCGSCESCMRLKRAYSLNGIKFDDYFENKNLS